ncbi:MAG TPA: IPT/TIG domain-containing protein [Bacteroidota bacterium]
MRHSARTLSLATAVLFGTFSGCTKKPDPSLYDPNWQSLPAPTITSISPPKPALAGVSTVTITGTNFSPAKANDVVYFDATSAAILTASATQITARAPNVVKDSILVTVAVLGSQYFSNYFAYNLAAAVVTFPLLVPGEVPYGIECDTSGNLYVSMISGGTGVGVKKITPDGTRADFSPQFSSAVNHWTGMKFGPGHFLYAAAGRNIVFRMPAGGGASAVWASALGGTVSDIDFDQQGNLWGAGPGGVIVEVKQDLTKKSFPFAGTASSARVFGGNLYVAAHRDSLVKIWSLPIIGDSLGAEQVYFDFGSHYSGYDAFAITFASDGSLFVGTNAPAAIVLVHPDQTFEPYYPGLLLPQPIAFAWGKGTTMYLSRGGSANPTILQKLNMQTSSTPYASAPYYGRLLP